MLYKNTQIFWQHYVMWTSQFDMQLIRYENISTNKKYCYEIFLSLWISNWVYQKKKFSGRKTFWWTCFETNNIHIHFYCWFFLIWIFYCIVWINTYWLFILCIWIDNRYFLFVLILNKCLTEFLDFMKLWKNIFSKHCMYTTKSFKNGLSLILTIMDDLNFFKIHIPTEELLSWQALDAVLIDPRDTLDL